MIFSMKRKENDVALRVNPSLVCLFGSAPWTDFGSAFRTVTRDRIVSAYTCI